MNNQRGFTLLEVLIALTIMAVAAAGFASASMKSASQADYLTLKTLASVVAINKIHDMQVSGTWPSPGRSDDTVEMAGHRWTITMDVDTTEVKSLRRLRISVGLDAKQEPLYSLTSFAGQH